MTIQRLDLGALLALGADVKWQGWHRDCDANIEADRYWIAVERIATIAAVLDWTAHLMGKTWTTATDWNNVLRCLADGTGGPLRHCAASAAA